MNVLKRFFVFFIAIFSCGNMIGLIPMTARAKEQVKKDLATFEIFSSLSKVLPYHLIDRIKRRLHGTYLKENLSVYASVSDDLFKEKLYMYERERRYDELQDKKEKEATSLYEKYDNDQINQRVACDTDRGIPCPFLVQYELPLGDRKYRGERAEDRQYYIDESLRIYAGKGKKEYVCLLLQHGANVNAADFRGHTALISAAFYNRVDIVSCLLQHGANVNAETREYSTALMFATARNNRGVVELLVQAGADVNFNNRRLWHWPGSDYSGSALMVAIAHNNVAMVELLLQYGADPDDKDEHNRTVLMYALWDKKYKIAKLLLEYGADVDAHNVSHCAPLKLVRGLDPSFEELLLRYSRPRPSNSCTLL